MIAKLSKNRLPRCSAGLFIITLLTGCATTGSDDPRDPLEGFNRGVYQFNKTADEVVFNPIGRGYNAITPEIVDEGVTNFFANLGEIANFANNILQLDVDGAANTVVRFMMNSTLGIGGFFDVAREGVPPEREDFGQTLAYWGIGSGPYLVLPFLGPSTARDGVGIAADTFMNPITYIESDTAQAGLTALGFIDLKSDLLTTGDLVSEAALDEYDFVKNAYFERRRGQIEDREGGSSTYRSYEDYEDGES